MANNGDTMPYSQRVKESLVSWCSVLSGCIELTMGASL